MCITVTLDTCYKQFSFSVNRWLTKTNHCEPKMFGPYVPADFTCAGTHAEAIGPFHTYKPQGGEGENNIMEQEASLPVD